MKRILTTLVVAMGFIGPLVTRLLAQEHALVADVPFSFVAGDRSMPAGPYRLSVANTSGSVYGLSDSRRHTAFVMLGAREDKTTTNPSLTFVCHGKDCMLAKVTPATGAVTYSIGHKAIEKYQQHKIGVVSMISIKLAYR